MTAAAVLAPYLATHGLPTIAFVIAAFFSKVCHQHMDRSVILFSAPVAVCARCLGIYTGTALGAMMRIERNTSFRLLGLALILNGIDAAVESLALHGNMPLLRLILGLSLGTAAGLVLTSRGADLLTR